jgi:RNA-directed DNA polymerase
VAQRRSAHRKAGRSPRCSLLANILLDDVDKELERRGHRFTRYADHLVILVKSHRAGERIMASVTRLLIRELPSAHDGRSD